MFICTNSHEIMTLESHKFPIFVDISMACQANCLNTRQLLQFHQCHQVYHIYEQCNFYEFSMQAAPFLTQHSIGKKKNHIRNIWNNYI